MKKGSAPHAARRFAKRSGARTAFIAAIFPLIVVIIAAAYSGGVSARGLGIFDLSRAAAAESGTAGEALAPMDSALITQIGFNPVNQPANFTAGVPNPASQPLRIQTQRSDGTGENVTGPGQNVFIQVNTSSPTGRFSTSASGPFNLTFLVLTIGNTQQNTMDFFYLDPTPGTVTLTGRVTVFANTGLTFGETGTVTKSVLPLGPTNLSFGTQPSSANKDAAIAPPVTVRLEDASGNLVTTSTRNVSLAIGTNPAGGTLGGTTTVAAVGGIATFNNISIDRAGNGYTLVASSSLPAPALTTATSVPFNINKLDQAIDFDELEDKTYGDDDFDVFATSSSGAQVSFSSLTTETCTAKGDVVHIVAAGTCTIRASLGGDSDYNPADDVDRSFTIHKADATVVVTPYDVIYDGQPHIATLVSIVGVNGETDAEVGTVDLSGTEHTNAGSYLKDFWTLTGTNNYNDASGNVSNNISKASATAHAGGGTATYDGTTKTPSVCAINGPGYLGDLTCSNDPGIVGPAAGSYTIQATVNGTGLSNFDITKIDGTYTIEKAPTVTTVTFEAGPYVYRGTPFAASARVTGPGGLDQAVAPVTYSGDCLNVTGSNGCVGTATYSESMNYLQSIGSSSITISRRALNVNASSHVLTFNDAVPAIMPAFIGFVPGENASVIDTPPTCSTAYTVGSPVGTYQTNCSGGLDNNYSFASYTPGVVTVNTACSAFNGFLSPIGGANAYPNIKGPGGSFYSPLRTFNMNSTIPFKFTATCFGSPLTTGIQTLSAQKYVYGLPVGDPVVIFDNHFRFQDGQWQLNFKTSDLGGKKGGLGTWLFEVTLFDGSRFNVWLAIRD